MIFNVLRGKEEVQVRLDVIDKWADTHAHTRAYTRRYVYICKCVYIYIIILAEISFFSGFRIHDKINYHAYFKHCIRGEQIFYELVASVYLV